MSEPQYYIYENLRLNSKGNQVKQLQMSLPKWTSKENLALDGIFGTSTQSAVKTYQREMGLSEDGVVGRATASRLGVWANLEKGFDISHWQTIIWDAIEPEYTFVNIKATEGATYVDPSFNKNVKGALEANLEVGAYHYTKFLNPPLVEAAKFLTEVTKHPQISSVYLDLEDRETSLSPSQIIDWVSLFKTSIDAFYAGRFGIYTSKNYLAEMGLDFKNEVFLDSLLWAADWNEQPFVYPWSLWNIWQFTNQGQVEWASSNIDLNYKVLPHF